MFIDAPPDLFEAAALFICVIAMNLTGSTRLIDMKCGQAVQVKLNGRVVVDNTLVGQDLYYRAVT